MAKISSVSKTERRKQLVKKYAGKYAKLKVLAADETLDETERLIARLKLAEIPRDGQTARARKAVRARSNARKYFRTIQPVTKEDKISSSDARQAVSRYLAGRLG